MSNHKEDKIHQFHGWLVNLSQEIPAASYFESMLQMWKQLQNVHTIMGHQR